METNTQHVERDCWCGRARHYFGVANLTTGPPSGPDVPPVHACCGHKARRCDAHGGPLPPGVTRVPRARRVAARPVQRRVSARPRAHRSPRRGTVKTAQDPGDDDGDDPDPVGAAVARLLADAPPFSVGQQRLLGGILGGAR